MTTPIYNDTTNELLVNVVGLRQQLDRTKKKLDIAVGALEDIAESNGDFITGSSTTLDAHEYAEMMLKQINQKEEQ